MIGRFLVAVSIVVLREGKVLIGRRSMEKDAAPGYWEYPSGRLEEEESPEAAVQREGLEELGVEVCPLRPIHSYFFRRLGVPSILIAYLAEVDGEPVVSSEHDEFKWVDVTEVNKYFKIEGLKEITEKLIQDLR